MTIDSHCHLNQADYKLPVSEIIKQATEEGVHSILAVACDPQDWDELLAILGQYKNVYGAIGIHPEYAHLDHTEALKKLPALYQNKQLIAFGEIGLDYHEAPESKEQQKDLFKSQIDLAHQLKRPVMVHTRDAEDDTYAILKESFDKGLLKHGGVIHCFTGSKEFAEKALKLGFYISASGVITFKSAKELRDTFAAIPLDKLLVETDAPWLAPEPFRGHPNQPAYVQQTLKKLAEIKGVSVQEMEKITTDNFYHLYLKDSQ